jgi:hypothetical protein
MANKKRQQTINKRNRERAVAEKRALKQQARQEKREAIRNGEEWPPVDRSPFDPPADEQQPDAPPSEAAPSEAPTSDEPG